MGSPYDTEARFRSKSGITWTGYMAHLTETCDEGAPRLVVHAEATPANVHEAMRTEPIHAALCGKGLAPSEHLVDAGYVSVAHLVASRQRFGIDLVGPPRPDVSWQGRMERAFGVTDFAVEWDRQRVRCPEGRTSTSWCEYEDKTRGRLVAASFSSDDCRACPSRARCTQAKKRGRVLHLHAREEHEALGAARARSENDAGWKLYAQRQGVESAIAQAPRARSACAGRATAG